MTKIRKAVRLAFAGTMVNMLVLFGISGSADAAGGKRPVVRSVCETGFRGQPAYDAQCLRRGTYKDGAALWLRDGDGKLRLKTERRTMCRDARELGSLRLAVTDWFGDVAYDNYRNHTAVLRWALDTAVTDCRELNVRDVRKG